MKRFLKSSLSIVLAITIIFSSAAVGLNEIDFNGLFAVKAEAASTSDLTFELNGDGNSYSVTDCKESATGSLTIPSMYNNKPVTSIGSHAFYNCTSLTAITIPDSVTSIGGYAFYNCTSLTSITIPDSVTSIGEYAFYNCTSLTSVAIPDSVTSIGNYAFKGCTNLTSITIPDSVTSISFCAFSGCTSLTSITIPDSVTSIDYGAFYNCTSLTSITIPDSVTSIGDSAFYNSGYYNNSSNWENNVLYINNHLIKAGSLSGNYEIKKGTKTIAGRAFYYRTNLTSITIPDSVTSIDGEAFYYCTSLESVYITDIEAWCNIDFDDSFSHPLCYGENLYLDGKLAKKLIIPEGTAVISGYAFYNCTSLTSITIPDSVTSIGDYAFYKCTSLTSVTIGDSVTNIDSSAFYNCTSLTSITIPYSVTSIGNSAFSGCTSLNSITIPDSVTSIGYYAFKNCDSLTSITIPDSVTSIGEEAFYNSGYYNNSSNWENNVLYINNHLIKAQSSLSENYEIKTGTKTIANYAFDDCTSLTSITIPDGVTSIDYGAFYNCTSLTSITIPDSVTSIGDYAFYKCTRLTSITIPDSVTSIDGYAFSNCTSLTSITIPDSVTSIGGSAFSSCTSLTSITIPDSVTSIGSSAFYSCKSLWSITIPDSVTSIGEEAFEYCTSLKYVTIGDGVTSIGSSAFYSCKSLTSVTIPGSVTTIGEWAFYDCTSLTSVTIGDGVTSIGDAAFYKCTSLTSITIPDSVTSIGDLAFDDCTSLTSVTIGDGVTSIGDYAFYNCSNLKYVFYKGNKTDWGKITIGFDNSYLTAAIIHYNTTDHIGGSWTIELKATCSTDGLKSSTCTVCGEAFEKTIPATGKHSFGEWIIDSEANCCRNGLKHRTCSVCGFVDEVTENTTNHSGECEVVIDNGIYTGVAIEPDVYVSYKGKALVNGSDFKLSFKNNINVGREAEAVVRGIGDYKSLNITKKFSILKRDISDADIDINVDSCVFDSYQQKPPITVVDDGVQLTIDKDYIVDYINNVAIGIATIRVIGINSCYGSVESDFRISEDNRQVYLQGRENAATKPDPLFSSMTMFAGNLVCKVPCFTKFFFIYSVKDVSTGQVIKSFDSGANWGTSSNYMIKCDFSNVTQVETYLIQFTWSDYGGTTYSGFLTVNVLPATTVNAKDYSLSVVESSSAKYDYILPITDIESYDLKTLGWFSSDNNIATVENGTVKWHAPGTVTITSNYYRGIKKTVELTKQKLNLETYGEIITNRYLHGESVIEVAYNGELLEKDVDYSASVTNYGSYSIAKVKGKGLFKGTITKRFFNDCGSVYVCNTHSLGNWITDKKATVYKAGSKHKECTECGETLKTATIKQLKCSKPVLKKVANVNSYVKVTWGTVKGADLYRVYRKTGTGEYEYIGSTTHTYFNDKEAGAGKTCRYIVRAKNEAGNSVASESLSIKHIDEPTLKSIENSAYGVLIKWDKVTGAEKYNVYRKVSGGEYKYIGATDKTYYTDKTAKSGTKYYYAIRGKRDTSVSSQSASLSKYYLTVPTLKTITNTEYGVKITWGKVTGAEKYSIYRKVSGGEYKYIGATTNTYYTDKTAESGTKYYYEVRAKKGETVSALSNAKSIYHLADTTLNTPTSTTSGIKLSWSKVTGAEGYMVYRKTDSGSYSQIATIEGVSKLSYTDATAKKGKKYTYKIKAYKSKTYSVYSNAKAITDKY